MKRNKLSRKITFLIVLIVVCGGIWFGLWLSKPIYPSFQKQMDSYSSVKEALSDSEDVLYPDIDSWAATEFQFFVNLDGRGRFAKPNGYLVIGLIDFQDLPCYLYLSCDPVYTGEDAQSMVYKEIPVFITSDEKSVIATFQIDDRKYNYCIHNTENQTTSAEKTQEFRSLGEALLTDYVKTFIDQKYTD